MFRRRDWPKVGKPLEPTIDPSSTGPGDHCSEESTSQETEGESSQVSIPLEDLAGEALINPAGIDREFLTEWMRRSFLDS